MDQIVTRPAAKPAPDIQQALELDASGKSRRRGRRWLWWGVAVLLAGGAAVAWSVLGQETERVSYRTVPAERTDMTIEVSATGTLAPTTQVDVSSELSGVLRSVPVQENQAVAKGDVLAELDTTRLEAQIERAEANVLAAEARVNEARTTLRETEQALTRQQSLARNGTVSAQAVETALAARDRAASAVETAEANVAVARADLKLQQADLSKTKIFAPIDGIVLTRSADPGQTVASSLQAPILFVIAEDLASMELKAAIDEADIGQVAKGQQARFTVDAFPDRRFEAEIADIAYAAVTTEGVVTYDARLTVDNEDMVLRPGMTATVSIVTRQADDIIAVPLSAFRFTPPAEEADRGFSIRDVFMPRMRGGWRGERGQPPAVAADGSRTLYVLRDGAPEPVSVATGASDGERMEIVSGLQDGDQVIVGTRGAGRGPGSGGRRGGG